MLLAIRRLDVKVSWDGWDEDFAGRMRTLSAAFLVDGIAREHFGVNDGAGGVEDGIADEAAVVAGVGV